MTRGLAAALAVLVSLAALAVGPAAGSQDRTVLLVYNNDIDGPIAETASTAASAWIQGVTVIVADSRRRVDVWNAEGFYDQTVRADVACVIGVGDDASEQSSWWADAAPGYPHVWSAQGDDRYETAHRVRQAIEQCVAGQ